MRFRKLRSYRLERGWTQKQLAEMVKVDVSTIRKYERGLINPSLKVAKRLSQVFGMPIEELFEEVSLWREKPVKKSY